LGCIIVPARCALPKESCVSCCSMHTVSILCRAVASLHVVLASRQTGRTIGPPRKAKIRIQRSAPWLWHVSACRRSIFLGLSASAPISPARNPPTSNYLGSSSFMLWPLDQPSQDPANQRSPSEPRNSFGRHYVPGIARSSWQMHVEAGSRRS
jgi:hypothetical protein